MKKKILFLVIALLLVAAVSGFSIGIGASFGLGLGQDVTQGVMLSLDLDQLPFLLGLGYNFGGNLEIAATGDYIMFRENLVDMLNLYAGVGGFMVFTEGEPSTFDFGLRVPVALYLFPVDFLELFVEVAPAFRFIPEPDIAAQSAVGFRFWF
jgi:hypothetical protein